MNKSDLINAVAKVTCTKVEAEAAINTVFDAIKVALKKGEDVQLIGFGSFAVQKREARVANIFGEKKKIPAKKTVKFRVGKALSDAVNGKKK